MKIRLFGVMRAFRNDSELSLGSVGQKAVLAVLALHAGRVITMDRLVEQLWGESPPSEPVHVVRVYVSRLRRVIEDDSSSPSLLVTEAGGYRLAIPPDSVDVLGFEQLAEGARSAAISGDQFRARDLADVALEMWSEEPLVEFIGQEFAEGWRPRLEVLRSDLVEIWAGAVLATGAAGTMVGRLEDLLVIEPYRERAWGFLAIAHYREGRQTEALRTLDRAKKTLADVGLEPGEELQDLEEAVFRHDPSLLAAPIAGVHNLPIPIDRFVGREAERQELIGLIRRHRLVTVNGPGGSGKTRLAFEAARTQIGRFRDGVWTVDLAPVDHNQLVPAIMEALATPRSAGRRDLDDIVRHLQTRQALLLLDNCEHLVDEVGQLAAAVLHSCPKVRIMTTSREPVRVPGEVVYQIPPLAVPGVDTADEVLRQVDAVALFLDRAALLGVELDDDDALRHVATIVHQLDGIPLAIELAAARLTTLQISELARRIGDVFATVGPAPRADDPRHRTLQAAFDWSYQLLSPEEQRGFEALSLVRGDFDLPAGIAVVGSQDAEATLEGLVAKSIITKVPLVGPRFRLLEPVRQYGLGRLEPSSAEEVLERRDRHFLTVAEQLYGVRTADHVSTQQDFGRERLHLEATLEHLLDKGEAQLAGDLVAGLSMYWVWHGLYERGRELHERALALGNQIDSETLDGVLHGLGFILSQAGNYVECDRVIQLAIDLGCNVDDVTWSNFRGSQQALRGNMRAGLKHLEHAAALARKQQSDRLAPTLINLASVASWSGFAKRSVEVYAEAVEAALEQWPGEPPALTDTLEVIVLRMQGHFSTAHDRWQETYDLRHLLYPFHQGVFLTEAAMVELARGNTLQARTLAQEALALDIYPEGIPVFNWVRANLVLAKVGWKEGDRISTKRLLGQLVVKAQTAGVIWRLAEIAELTAEVALEEEREELGAVLLESAAASRELSGLARDPYESKQCTRLRSRLPEAPFTVDNEGLGALLGEYLDDLPISSQSPRRTRTSASAADSGAHTSPGRPRI